MPAADTRAIDATGICSLLKRAMINFVAANLDDLTIEPR
jgi:hypothetical protein